MGSRVVGLDLVGALLLECRVYGTPAPQGSKHGRPIYRGRGDQREFTGKVAQVESSKKRLRPWREAVKAAALDATRPGHSWTDTGPVDVSLVFILDRPKGHYRTGRNAHLLRDGAPDRPTTKPDLDKLVRSTLDAIKDAGVYRDDSQVVDIRTTKVYASGVSGPPGAVIIVRSTE